MMAAFLLMFAMQADAAAEPTRPMASGATWVSQPTQAQFLRAYPTQAEWDSTPGRAVLDCVFTAAGRLSNCTVTSEEPAGRHFGAAALKLAPFFRAVAIPAGASLEGKPISLPVAFGAKLDGVRARGGG
jgi:protein TonB